MSNDVLACFEKARIAVDLASSSQCQGQVITEVQVAKRQAVFIPSAVSSVFHGVTALNLQDDATGETWSCNLGRHDQQRGTQTVVSYSIPSTRDKHRITVTISPPPTKARDGEHLSYPKTSLVAITSFSPSSAARSPTCASSSSAP